jgi:hypothetical protein
MTNNKFSIANSQSPSRICAGLGAEVAASNPQSAIRNPHFPWLFLFALSLLASLSVTAQNVQHLSITQPGGMPGLPVVTGVSPTTNGMSVTWDGPAGYYQLFEKHRLTDAHWVAVGRATNLNRQATVSTTVSNGFFVVAGPSPNYAGSQTCTECHSSILSTESHTLHAGTFTNAQFVAAGGQTNASCLPCHTVGYGLPTGFISLARTPRLANVQCENCHGPAANHASNPGDPTLVPRVEVAATVCGGCHTGAEHPTFDEWKTSEHTEVISNLNATTQIDACGRCHSGSVRVCLVKSEALPVGDANVGITCVVCHDPHQTNSAPFQLRYPIASTNYFYMPTNGTFASQNNPNINVCAQCHNHAGAAWTNSAAPPHGSPQYNMLLGSVGELDSGPAHYEPASHGILLTNQCVACHMQTSPYVSPAIPANTGHTFAMNSYNVCLQCHPFPELMVQYEQRAISNRVQELKLELNYWAQNKAPAALWTNYGNRAWEYTAPGSLSPGGPGPNAAEQRLISTNIQKARFNVYLVLSDGSIGVHNPQFSAVLLDAADDFIYEEFYP